MLVEIVRYFRGYVDFSAKGKFPERFLNITAANGLVMWNALPIAEGISGAMSVADYRKIRPLCKKTGLRAKIERKHGLPFILARYKDRIGIPIGAGLGICLILFLSNFFWTVSVTGCQTVSENDIIDAIAARGVSVGSYKNNINMSQVARETMLEIDELKWMSINPSGCNASVEVKEKVEKPIIDESGGTCNIKAKKDGVITDIKAAEGTIEVKKGSGVTKGDLLVSGVNMTKMNTARYVRAEAEVMADVYSEKEISLEKEYDYSYISGNNKNRKMLYFLGLRMPASFVFGNYEALAYSRSEKYLNINEVALPVGVITEKSSELCRTKATLNPEKAEIALENILTLYETFEKSGDRLVSRKTKLTSDESSFKIKADYVFNENIAETVEFNVTDSE